jgi:hypothetical protein
MKKNIFIGCFILLATGAFSQIDLSVGGQMELSIGSMTEKYELDSDNYEIFNQIDTIPGFGVFVDAVYVRLSLAYAMTLGATQKRKLVYEGVEFYDESIDSTENYSWTFLNIGLLGKFPIALGSIVIWPAAGILYSITLSRDANADGEADKLDEYALNDLYLSAGCGLDVKIMSTIYMTGSVLCSYNFTPNRLKNYELPDEESIIWYIISIYLGVGYIL